LNFYVQFLAAGGTVEGIKTTLASSQEFFTDSQADTNANATTPNQKYVDFLFVHILNRPADPGAVTFFGSQLDSGRPRSALVASLLTSNEAEQVLVSSFYQQFLHRAADSGGLNHFVTALQGGERDESVIAELVASDEYFSRV